MLNLGMHLSTNEAALYCITPMWCNFRQLPLDITANVCACDTCVVDPRLPVHQQDNRNCKAVHTEHTLNNSYFDTPAIIESGHAVPEHVCNVCLRSLVLSTLLPRGAMVWYGLICPQVYSQL